jgi:hypothetical protein
MNAIITKKISDDEVLAIVLAKDWFDIFFDEKKMPYFITEHDYVVCKWFDFHDGVNSHIEGKETIAICRNEEDAYILFNK